MRYYSSYAFSFKCNYRCGIDSTRLLGMIRELQGLDLTAGVSCICWLEAVPEEDQEAHENQERKPNLT
jgi:hypothetical protein